MTPIFTFIYVLVLAFLIGLWSKDDEDKSWIDIIVFIFWPFMAIIFGLTEIYNKIKGNF